MFRNRVRLAAVMLTAAALYACDDQTRPTAPDGEAPLPTSIIVDASTGGNDGVLFLPPLRPLGPRNGTFDPTIPLRIEITHQGTATVEQYSVAAGDITVAEDHYALQWTAPTTAVAGAVFEVRAWALSFELGRVDIVVAGSGRDYVELKQGDESATIRNASRTLPIHVWLNTEALAPTEEQLEQECTSGGGVIDCDVEVIPNSSGGSVTVFDESDPDAPLAGELTVDPGDVVDQDGVPVEAYVLSLLHVDQPATQSTTVPADQQFPFVLRATLTDGDGNPLRFATGASLVLCQPADLETNQGAPYFLPSALAMLQQIIKVDDGTTTFLPTTYGAPECEGFQPPVQIGLESLGSVEGLGRLARLGLRKLKHFVVAEPLRAGHGGLTTTKSILDLSEFAGALPTDPSVSTATVPDGTAGQPTEIAIQAKVSGASTVFDQVDGGDAVAVEVTGANSATLTVGNGGVIDHGDGTYTATYTPVNAGTDQVAITIVDPTTSTAVPISGSPFTSIVAGSISVSVVEWTGDPFVGAQLNLAGPTIAAATTDASGSAVFSGLAAGQYTLTTAATGFLGTSQTVDVGAPGAPAVTAHLCPDLGTTIVGTMQAQPPSAAAGAVSTIPSTPCLTRVQFVNNTTETVQATWIDYNGNRISAGYPTLAPGQSAFVDTWPEHPWILVGDVSGDLAFFVPLPISQAPARAVVENPAPSVQLQPSSTVAAGSGQLVVVQGGPFPTDARAFVTQGGATNEVFIFDSPSGSGDLYVRLALAGFVAAQGPAQLVVTDGSGETPLGSAAITVAAEPAAPVLRDVYGFSTPPFEGSCPSGLSAEPVGVAEAGHFLGIQAWGTDTSGAQVEMTQDGLTVLVTPTCTTSNDSVGLLSDVAVPGSFQTTADVTIRIRTTVGGVTSPWSNSVVLTGGGPSQQ